MGWRQINFNPLKRNLETEDKTASASAEFFRVEMFEEANFDAFEEANFDFDVDVVAGSDFDLGSFFPPFSSEA